MVIIDLILIEFIDSMDKNNDYSSGCQEKSHHGLDLELVDLRTKIFTCVYLKVILQWV